MTKFGSTVQISNLELSELSRRNTRERAEAIQETNDALMNCSERSGPKMSQECAGPTGNPKQVNLEMANETALS